MSKDANKNLVIVESPTKAHTIQRFLGKDFLVLSSFGHIRDLPKSSLGVDIENNFQPKFVVPKKSRKVVNFLKKESEKAKNVILATDEDREGEAIAYHLKEVLGLEDYQRIVFHEITKSAIEEALNHPRKIDMDLVYAQFGRRVLDRIVGYMLSPFLWRKVARGLSAGRVQSVAVRLIVEREREIEKFVPQEYWTIVAKLLKFKIKNEKLKIDQKEFEAVLIKKNGKVIPKLGIRSKEEAEKIVSELQDAEFIVKDIKRKEQKVLEKVKKDFAKATKMALQNDIQKAMTEFNKKRSAA